MKKTAATNRKYGALPADMDSIQGNSVGNCCATAGVVGLLAYASHRIEYSAASAGRPTTPEICRPGGLRYLFWQRGQKWEDLCVTITRLIGVPQVTQGS